MSRGLVVAAQASDDIGFPDIFGQEFRHPYQRGIARGMAMGVVDRFHAVDVEIEHAADDAVALRERQHAREFAHEGAPVDHR